MVLKPLVLKGYIAVTENVIEVLHRTRNNIFGLKKQTILVTVTPL